MRLLLDTAVLGEVCHPRKYADVRMWLARAVAHHDLLISEVADYELRRELLRIGSHRSDGCRVHGLGSGAAVASDDTALTVDEIGDALVLLARGGSVSVGAAEART